MPVIDLSHMIDHSNQLIHWILHRSMMIVGDDLRQIESSGYFDSVIEFLFAKFAIGEAFDL